MARRRGRRRDLEADMARLTPAGYEQTLRKSDRINFAVTPTEKNEIRSAATRYGLTVTEYFLRLHRLAEVAGKPKTAAIRRRRTP